MASVRPRGAPLGAVGAVPAVGAAPAVPPERVRAARILVVNDEPDVARLLALELGDLGFRNVLTCSSAEEALDLMAIRAPAAVVSDVNMGTLDGFQLCRILKSPSYQAWNDIPVILCSQSFRDSRATSLALEAGAFAFVEDPTDTERLVAALVEALEIDVAESGERSSPSPTRRAVAIGFGDAATRDIVVESLSVEGFCVDLYQDPVLGLRAVQDDEDLIKVVLLASSLPGADALRVIDRIRRCCEEVAIVVLGNGADRDTSGRMLLAGADDYIDEPATAFQVRSVCRSAMLRREYRRTSARIESSEQRLRATEDRFRRQSGFLNSVMESSGDGILVLDAALRVAKLNAAAARIFESRRDDIVGLRVVELLGEKAIEKLEGVVAGHPTSLGAKFELERSCNGRDKVLSVGASRCSEGVLGTELLLIVRDMTEERKLSARLSQAQKMDSLGALAGGMAHDFNNILATILPHAEMIRHTCERKPALLKRARAIEAAARRGGELTRRLLAFARPKPKNECVAIPNSCVETTAAMLRDTLDRKIRVETRLMKEHVGVAIDSAQLEHVLLNLAINARDAMPDGGVLRFETRVLTKERARSGGPERTVQIVVEDTGHGMDEATMRKVFDPFFTTKSEGRGTGLGLSTAYSIVNAAGGVIEVESRPGEGSSFRISLPGVKAPSEAQVEVATVVRGQRERVLVVDDEATVRELTVEMLRRLGYQVDSVASGREAIELITEGKPYDLVLLDMIMPDMDGRDTYRAVRKRHPKLAFVIASGDPDNAKTMELADEGVAILQKPFSLATLSVQVRTSLVERQPAEKVGRTA